MLPTFVTPVKPAFDKVQCGQRAEANGDAGVVVKLSKECLDDLITSPACISERAR